MKASRFELLAKQIVEGFISGLHRSPFHGFSVEFSEHRNYTQGESPRNIDWKLYARTDRLFIKRFEEETNLRCHLLVDTSSSMEFPQKSNKELDQLNKKGFALYTAAALSMLLGKQRDAVSLTLFDNETRLQTPCKNNKNHTQWLIQQLSSALDKELPEGSATKLSECILERVKQSSKRALFIIISDFLSFETEKQYDAFAKTLQYLKHQNHEVIAINVKDQKLEVDFAFGNQPLRFKDLETGQEIKLEPQEFKTQYLEAKQAQEQKLKSLFYQYRMEFVDADIQSGFDNILLSYLNKRKRQ